ncbi:hypothetical protein ETC03_24830, partial [Geobacillus sp. MMMUD3]|nr:hypothetical protein [Geobacillus sp. MMMUD3]
VGALPATPAWSSTTPEQGTEESSQPSPPAAGADDAATAGNPTVVFGIPGLTIGDIDPERTPNLFELASGGAIANLNVRTIGSATCPASGWLSLGAGARAVAGPEHEPDLDNPARCPSLIAPTSAAGATAEAEGADPSAAGGDEDLAEAARIPDFASVREPNEGTGYTVDYGMLARLVREAPAA